MRAADIYQFMDNPSLLTEDTLPQLKQIVDEFPCFPVARMLYLKNLAVLNDIRFGAELKKMALYIPDRKKLFSLIEGERYGLQLPPPEDETSGHDDTFSLIDAFLSGQTAEKETGTSLLFQPSVSSDYMFWSLTEEKEPEEEKDTVRLQHHDLIDSFIKSEEQRAPGVGLALPQDAAETAPPPSVTALDESASKSLGDSYFTETLAHIYIKQKRYDKALQIIKNLSLNYPEKNAYFADQIRFLEKLIINTKK